MHHAHQDMNNCNLPRPWYVDPKSSLFNQPVYNITYSLSASNTTETKLDTTNAYYVRSNGNCYAHSYMPPKRTKERRTWCHHEKLSWNNIEHAMKY